MTTFTKTNKSSNPTYTKLSANSATWTNITETLFNSFLLLEDGSYLLHESGDKIILDQSIPSPAPWTKTTKS
jgi:hypothetical protein